jgi:hypothetical protein
MKKLLAFAVLAVLPWQARAQNNPPAASVYVSDAERAGDDDWFLDNIQPSLDAERARRPEATIQESPVLYDANEAAPMPGKPIPDRRVYRHRPHVGPVCAVVMAGDLPPTRGEWTDAQDWHDNDSLRPELFRFWFEQPPAEATTTPPDLPH